MQNALVSIITPCYNCEQYVHEMVQSVQNQTYENWELIVVDDASTDESVAIIENYASNDHRIKVIRLKKNRGTGIARNTALEYATGKYISFLDADDLWKPNKLETQVNFLLINDLPFTFSYYECINEDGKALNITVEAPKTLSYRQLFFCNYVGNLTGIYDVDYFGKISICNTRKRQDWIMWLTVLQRLKVAQPVPQSLAYYRVRHNSLSASKLDLVKHNYAVYRTFHGLTMLKSLLCMIIFLFTQLIVKPRYIKASI